MKSKLKTVNFVYGELSFIGMCQVLRDYVRELCQGHKYGEKQAEGLCFVDLGSGAGVSIAAAVLSGFFSTIIGVELMRTKVNICRAMISQLKELGSKELRFIIGGSILPPQSVECTLCTTVDIIEGDFLLVPWWTVADVVYAACTCFSEDLMQSIVENVLKLKCGSLIVLLDRPILVNLPQQFELLGSFEAAASWGETAVFVYQKI